MGRARRPCRRYFDGGLGVRGRWDVRSDPHCVRVCKAGWLPLDRWVRTTGRRDPGGGVGVSDRAGIFRRFAWFAWERFDSESVGCFGRVDPRCFVA